MKKSGLFQRRECTWLEQTRRKIKEQPTNQGTPEKISLKSSTSNAICKQMQDSWAITSMPLHQKLNKLQLNCTNVKRHFITTKQGQQKRKNIFDAK